MQTMTDTKYPRHGEVGSISDNDDTAVTATERFNFGRIFHGLRPFTIKVSSAEALGSAMTNDSGGDSNIPAGYTYLGQFIDHDMTLDATGDNSKNADPGSAGSNVVTDAELIQARSPSLDLDSLYGSTGDRKPERFLDGTGVKFIIGRTRIITAPPHLTEGHSNKSLTFDLPRSSSLSSRDAPTPKALIADARNDENLAVAQTHLAFMKFHNVVADITARDSSNLSPDDVFLATRELVTRHYQYIVLHDFVSKLILDKIYESVIKQGNTKLFNLTAAEVPFMPLEFSVAAFRLGHSLVRDEYDWNLNFNETKKTPANFEHPLGISSGARLSLITFTTVGNPSKSGRLRAEKPLPSNWIIDWRRFYDFSGITLPALGSAASVDMNVTKLIDPNLSSGLASVPRVGNLATANLLRGSRRSLPSGQDIAHAVGVQALSSQELKANLPENSVLAIENNEFDRKSPLWFYILQEANLQAQGQSLGEVGSQIVAETFVNLIRTSRTSILGADNAPSWNPSESPLRLNDGAPIDTMPRLLAFVDEHEPLINPLEDRRFGSPGSCS